MGNTIIIRNCCFIWCLLLFSFGKVACAQIVIGSPSLGFSQACASSTFNSYNVTFIFSPESALASSNQFILEMSDASGDFSSATVVFTSQVGEFTTSPATLNFSLPNTTSGEGYRVRVKSTAPAATSSGSATFAAYYKLQDSPFTINNLVPTGAFCQGGSYLLTIDNPGTGDNDSPLNYPSLTFNWFRETGPTTSVFISQGNTLEVTEEGTYFVKTNYGTCTSNSFSNRVTISEAISGEANATISSSLGSPFCPDEGMTTLSTIAGNGYQWFQDGVLIPEATEQMYQTDESGTFSVQIDLGNCQALGSIDLVSENFITTLNVPDTNEIEAGESIEIIASTTAVDPIFEWYFNDVLISGEQTESYIATEFGTYTLVITQTNGCVVSNEFIVEINEALDLFPDVENIPNIISPNGDGINDTWIIPTPYVSGTNTEVTIFSRQGEMIFNTTDYQNNWPIDQLDLTSINKVFYYIIKTSDSDIKKGSITVIK
ncbi:gliding motility-associated C-terminal domain-containing protein [Sediminibacter sp. Hel_I_10]|uniref:T9SS type B sorting domain-containing protein n=1 Tax=Sediminibacter sp. Hel_I_10 TaxID=1392490 RepID=UPI00068D6367|nr:gliding motility-associated C-terminal domain-containing protein [Sediminibacter sp. Hel_I_10]